jgi:hypothetical protein
LGLLSFLVLRSQDLRTWLEADLAESGVNTLDAFIKRYLVGIKCFVRHGDLPLNSALMALLLKPWSGCGIGEGKAQPGHRQNLP